MKIQIKLVLWVALAALLTSCSTSTMITGSWRKPNATANGYHNIFIAAISSNIPAKQAVEAGLEERLQQIGLTVEKSMDVFPPNINMQTGQQKELVLSKSNLQMLMVF